jgi:hypothetical protein
MYGETKNEILEELWPTFCEAVNGHWLENPIKSREIQGKTGILPRIQAELINYGIMFRKTLINSSSQGYYIPKNVEEGLDGLKPLEERAESLAIRVSLSKQIINDWPEIVGLKIT